MEWPGRTIIFVEVGGRGDGNSQKNVCKSKKAQIINCLQT